MEINPTNRIILSTEKFKGSPIIDQTIDIPLKQSSKNIVEYDRSVDLNLVNVFDEERQRSTNFRPVTKFTILFENALTGTTTYPPFRDNLYYTNEIENAVDYYYQGNTLPPLVTNQNVGWDGFPQYSEFDFIRTDKNVVGYTEPPNNHVSFKSVSATTYNWSHYVSYPFENLYNKNLYTIEPGTNINWSWVASDGLPYFIISGVENNNNEISFKSPVRHGLSVGEFVYLSNGYNGEQLFRINSLGNNGSGSDEYIFNILNIGYTGNTFITNTQGTFKRVINDKNSGDTISEYYIRRHKIMTKPECAVLVNAGFENNIYGDKTKCEIRSLTPNQISRKSIKEGSRAYTLSFNCDIDIDGLIDNQGRPLTQLFFTTIWRGYFGWTSKLRQGWEFNTFLQNVQPQPWWDDNNVNSNTNITRSSYTKPLANASFSYNNFLNEGDFIDGDYCEWNNYEQLERVVSTYQHKIKYNQNHFSLKNDLPITNQIGYFYQPHNPIEIASFSEYIEEGSSDNIVGIPPYAQYSTLSSLFRWRDKYPYGFIDSDGVGVDYPFLNNTHYPYVNTIFRITPENYNIPSEYAQGLIPTDINVIAEPIDDECE